MSDLKLEVVLISGANGLMGIGAAFARALSVKGADCFLTYLTKPGKLKDVSAWVQGQHRNSLVSSFMGIAIQPSKLRQGQ